MNTQIQSTVRDYVQAYLQADAELLAKAFHGETRLHSVSESGTLERTEMKDWLVNIRARKEKGDVRQGDFQLALLDQTGDSAVAKVVITLPKLRFTDYLSLLRIEGAWKITGKIYTAEAR